MEEEFSDKVNSVELHEILRKRKLKKEETLQEYYLVMKELASRGKLELEVLIQYVIDGIQDDINNKLVLYEAKKLKDFKAKLKVYETIRKRNKKKTMTNWEKSDYAGKGDSAKKTASPGKIASKDQDPEMRCYNCGAKEHKSKDCKKRVR